MARKTLCELLINYRAAMVAADASKTQPDQLAALSRARKSLEAISTRATALRAKVRNTDEERWFLEAADSVLLGGDDVLDTIAVKLRLMGA